MDEKRKKRTDSITTIGYKYDYPVEQERDIFRNPMFDDLDIISQGDIEMDSEEQFKENMKEKLQHLWNPTNSNYSLYNTDLDKYIDDIYCLKVNLEEEILPEFNKKIETIDYINSLEGKMMYYYNNLKNLLISLDNPFDLSPRDFAKEINKYIEEWKQIKQEIEIQLELF